MSDLYNNQKFNFNINAVSGTIRKSHPKSIICKTGDSYLLNMNDADRENCKRYDSEYHEVVVLQVMILKEEFIIEFVNKEDFEEKEQC